MKGIGLLGNLLNWLANTQPPRNESLLITHSVQDNDDFLLKSVMCCSVMCSVPKGVLFYNHRRRHVLKMWEISVIYCNAKHSTANRRSTGIPRRKLLKSPTLAKPWLMRSKSNDKCGIRRTTLAIDTTATTGSC